jgi:hypothetical protein
MQIDISEGLDSGSNNWDYEAYNADADGGHPKGPLFVLLPDPQDATWTLNTTAYEGTTTEYIYGAYAAGDHCFVYTPMPGEEFNLLLANESGTADIAAGTMLMIDDGTGTLNATAGTPETEPFMLLVDVDGDLAGVVLAHVIYTGY